MTFKKVGIVGSGAVAQALGAGFIKRGRQVMLGTRDPGKLKDWQAKAGKGAQAGDFSAAAAFGDICSSDCRRPRPRRGWECENLGGPAAARAIEPLAMLWCIPGFKSNDWMHAFKMLRP